MLAKVPVICPEAIVIPGTYFGSKGWTYAWNRDIMLRSAVVCFQTYLGQITKRSVALGRSYSNSTLVAN